MISDCERCGGWWWLANLPFQSPQKVFHASLSVLQLQQTFPALHGSNCSISRWSESTPWQVYTTPIGDWKLVTGVALHSPNSKKWSNNEGTACNKRRRSSRPSSNDHGPKRYPILLALGFPSCIRKGSCDCTHQTMICFLKNQRKWCFDDSANSCWRVALVGVGLYYSVSLIIILGKGFHSGVNPLHDKFIQLLWVSTWLYRRASKLKTWMYLFRWI